MGLLGGATHVVLSRDPGIAGTGVRLVTIASTPACGCAGCGARSPINFCKVKFSLSKNSGYPTPHNEPVLFKFVQGMKVPTLTIPSGAENSVCVCLVSKSGSRSRQLVMNDVGACGRKAQIALMIPLPPFLLCPRRWG